MESAVQMDQLRSVLLDSSQPHESFYWDAENEVDEAGVQPVRIWGVPFAPWTFSQILNEVERLIEKGRAAYFMTVNLHTTMLIHNCPKIRGVVAAAEFVVADGMPLIWVSRLRQRSLPERVA